MSQDGFAISAMAFRNLHLIQAFTDTEDTNSRRFHGLFCVVVHLNPQAEVKISGRYVFCFVSHVDDYG